MYNIISQIYQKIIIMLFCRKYLQLTYYNTVHLIDELNEQLNKMSQYIFILCEM